MDGVTVDDDLIVLCHVLLDVLLCRQRAVTSAVQFLWPPLP